MVFNDYVQLRGSLMLELRSLTGQLIHKDEVHNLVVTAGRRWILQQLESTDIATARTISHMAIGSDTTAPATGNTALGGEYVRKAISSFDTTNLTANPPNWTAQISYASNEGNTTLAEVGMFNSSAAGTMINRATFASFVKATSNTLSISYTLSN